MNSNFFDYFEDLTDPRIDRNKVYSLKTLVFITISAVLAGAENFTEIAEFAKQKVYWLKKFIELPDGKTPSHDTLNDIFKRIKPDEFQNCFINWTTAITSISSEELIAIDGKTIRGSFDKYDNKSAIHMISAWACTNDLVLGQLKTADKSNEITAIPELIKVLEIAGSIVSIDAMGCQKTIAEVIIDNDADYILAVKDNQASLSNEIKSTFNNSTANIVAYEKTEKNQGRIESRKCQVIEDLKFIDESKNWKSLKSIIKISSEREIVSTGKKSKETRYYISSKLKTAEEFNSLIRNHWAIENKLHWVLDVNFNEDKSRIRKGFADENFSTVRRIALNIIKLHPSKKTSQRGKRKKAGWSDKFLEELLQFKPD